MPNTNQCLHFPPHLEPPVIRSLSLAFILEEILKTEINYDRLSYYCENLCKENSLKNEVLKLRIANLENKQEQIFPFFCALLPYLFQSRTDENLLLKLLELKEQLNLKLGPETIEKLLRSFSSDGFSHVKTIIAEGLTRRGFSSFLAEKEHLFDTLEICQPTQV